MVGLYRGALTAARASHSRCQRQVRYHWPLARRTRPVAASPKQAVDTNQNRRQTSKPRFRFGSLFQIPSPRRALAERWWAVSSYYQTTCGVGSLLRQTKHRMASAEKRQMETRATFSSRGLKIQESREPIIAYGVSPRYNADSVENLTWNSETELSSRCLGNTRSAEAGHCPWGGQ
jgi:hypothetical protein